MSLFNGPLALSGSYLFQWGWGKFTVKIVKLINVGIAAEGFFDTLGHHLQGLVPFAGNTDYDGFVPWDPPLLNEFLGHVNLGTTGRLGENSLCSRKASTSVEVLSICSGLSPAPGFLYGLG